MPENRVTFCRGRRDLKIFSSFRRPNSRALSRRPSAYHADSDSATFGGLAALGINENKQ